MNKNNFSKYNILGLNLSDITQKQLNDYIKFTIAKNEKIVIPNLNIHCVNLAHSEKWLQEFLNNHEVTFCDGDGVRIGAKILGYHISEKITYNRWIWDFANICQDENISWYLIGSKIEIIEIAVKKLKDKYPRLNILGYRDGYFKDQKDLELTIRNINEKKPNILIIGMGMPLQEKFLYINWTRIEANVALTGGAVFDYISGETKMTPNIFYKLKLEWFYRLVHEPKRLFKRYIVGNPVFFFRIIKNKIGLTKY